MAIRGRGKGTQEYLKTSEVARLLRVSSKTVARWARDNKLPYIVTLGGHRRFPAEYIRRLSERLASDETESY